MPVPTPPSRASLRGAPSRSAGRGGPWRAAFRPPTSDARVDESTDAVLDDAALGRRAQLLATEHWGLLAARSTAQSELLTRITIFLTLVSAGLVTIGLLGQATDFSGWFGLAAISILAFLSLIGVMTHVRVFGASEEDMMYVIAMNRIRAAYVELDPGVARYFLAGVHDDEVGMQRTYSFLRRRGPSHLLGSSMMIILVVVACVFSLLGGAVATVSGAGTGWAIVIGAVVGALYVTGMLVYGAGTYTETWRRYRPLHPTPAPDEE